MEQGQDLKFNGLPFAGMEVDKLAQTVSPGRGTSELEGR